MYGSSQRNLGLGMLGIKLGNFPSIPVFAACGPHRRRKGAIFGVTENSDMTSRLVRKEKDRYIEPKSGERTKENKKVVKEK